MMHLNEYLDINKFDKDKIYNNVDINDLLYAEEEDNEWFWFFQIVGRTKNGYKLQSIRPKVVNKEWIPSDEKQAIYDGYIEDNEIKIDYPPDGKTHVLKYYDKDKHLIYK